MLLENFKWRLWKLHFSTGTHAFLKIKGQRPNVKLITPTTATRVHSAEPSLHQRTALTHPSNRTTKETPAGQTPPKNYSEEEVNSLHGQRSWAEARPRGQTGTPTNAAHRQHGQSRRAEAHPRAKAGSPTCTAHRRDLHNVKEIATRGTPAR